MSADRIVALIAVLMCMVIVSNGGTFRSMRWQKRALLGAIWAVIIGVVAVIAARMTI